jgi:hypothetical protein
VLLGIRIRRGLSPLKEAPPMKHRPFAAPWVFVFAEDLLPGIFSIQPFEPTPDLLMRIDPEGVILEEVLYAFLVTLAVCAKGRPLTGEESLRRLSSMAGKRIKRVLGLKEKLWVLPLRELHDRVARGEFSLRRPTEEDADRWRRYWAPIQSRVYNDIYIGKKTLPVPVIFPRRTTMMEEL